MFCLFMQNVIDVYVKHTNSGVSMAAITLMLHITKDMPSVCQDVYKRLKGECYAQSSNTTHVKYCNYWLKFAKVADLR